MYSHLESGHCSQCSRTAAERVLLLGCSSGAMADATAAIHTPASIIASGDTLRLAVALNQRSGYVYARSVGRSSLHSCCLHRSTLARVIAVMLNECATRESSSAAVRNPSTQRSDAMADYHASHQCANNAQLACESITRTTTIAVAINRRAACEPMCAASLMCDGYTRHSIVRWRATSAARARLLCLARRAACPLQLVVLRDLAMHAGGSSVLVAAGCVSSLATHAGRNHVHDAVHGINGWLCTMVRAACSVLLAEAVCMPAGAACSLLRVVSAAWLRTLADRQCSQRSCMAVDRLLVLSEGGDAMADHHASHQCASWRASSAANAHA